MRIDRPDPALIPQFTAGAAYVVDIRWTYIDEYLTDIGCEVDLDPDFQRPHVWTELQQREYVEFVLRRGDSGKVLLWNAPKWPSTRSSETLVLVDGKQRLEAVRRFIADELEIFGGWKRSDFDGHGTLLRVHVAGFKFHINDLETRAEMLDWYLACNARGTSHTDAELETVQAMLDVERRRGRV